MLPPPVYAFKMLKKLADYINFDYSSVSHEIALPQRKSDQTYALSEHESKMCLKEFGVAAAEELIVTSRREAEIAAEKMPGAFAMKIESAEILHKSDVGGVLLNLKGAKEAGDAFDLIMENVKKHCPEAGINGILMVPMLKPGLEMIIGVNNDPQFGPMIMAGMGGIFVELFKDVVVYPAPVNKAEAMRMLQSLKAFKLLNGYRGGEKYDIDALCDTIVSVGNFAAANKDSLKELDINPLFVYPEDEGVGVADSLIVKYGEKRRC